MSNCLEVFSFFLSLGLNYSLSSRLFPQGPIPNPVGSRFYECPVRSTSVVFLFPEIWHLLLLRLAVPTRVPRGRPQVPDQDRRPEASVFSALDFLSRSSSPSPLRSSAPAGNQNSSDPLKKDQRTFWDQPPRRAQMESWIHSASRLNFCDPHFFRDVLHPHAD
jgi:hypothetical protein